MSVKKRRPKKQGPPRTSDTKDLIVMVVTQRPVGDSVQFGSRAYGAEHNLTNEELLGLVGMLAASIIMPAIEEHGYQPEFIPAAMSMIEQGMREAFVARLNGLVHMDSKAIILEN